MKAQVIAAEFAAKLGGVFVYLVAVLLAIGLLFAITAVPGKSANLFPNPSADELVQAVQWVWECPSKSCP